MRGGPTHFQPGEANPAWKGGVTRHPLYDTWRGMHRRCEDRQHFKWNLYGGRGIRVCERWDDFWAFAEDVGERPPGHTLDRVDVDGAYSPDNVRWATVQVQRANQRRMTRRELDAVIGF